jgi:hypothetical protein
MSQNHPTSTLACAAFAKLLPLATRDLLDEPNAAWLRSHLATCPHCQAELALYDQLEGALRRSFAPPAGVSLPFSRAEILQTLDHETEHLLSQPIPIDPPSAPARPPRRARHWLAGLPAVAALLVIVLIVAFLFPALRGHMPGMGSATPPVEIGSDTELHSISMVSPTEGWAVGYATPAHDPNSHMVVLMHDTHGVWSRFPTTITGQLNSVSMDSANDGWAVGDDGLLLHYDGITWRQATTRLPLNLNRVQMLSATDGWAVGEGFDEAPSGMAHYDGHQWTVQFLDAAQSIGVASHQAHLELSGLSMISASEGWASGAEIFSVPNGPPQGVILHYVNGDWQVQAQNLFNGAIVESISMASATEGWAVGYSVTYISTTTSNPPGIIQESTGLLLHYTGGTWTSVSNPLGTTVVQYTGILSEVALGPASNGWLVGAPLIDTPGLLHYNGSQWIPVSPPDASAFKDNIRSYVLTGFAIMSATESWAVGYKLSTEAGGLSLGNGAYQPTITPVILHYLHGTWSIYHT